MVLFSLVTFWFRLESICFAQYKHELRYELTIQKYTSLLIQPPITPYLSASHQPIISDLNSSYHELMLATSAMSLALVVLVVVLTSKISWLAVTTRIAV